jgi:hypothetical protein
MIKSIFEHIKECRSSWRSCFNLGYQELDRSSNTIYILNQILIIIYTGVT